MKRRLQRPTVQAVTRATATPVTRKLTWKLLLGGAVDSKVPEPPLEPAVHSSGSGPQSTPSSLQQSGSPVLLETKQALVT